ncbi:MAG TPA: DUF4235 domain-containing protein [Streptosporangiaceae bacterium]|nr:DUF4235 domain-containing protein [Streptosporangiaceae bacterium]
MSDKQESFGIRAVGGLAALAAAYVARKIIARAWTRAVGKEPPAHPEDPQIGLAEALGWAVVTGVGMEAARLLAARAATRPFRSSPGRDPR